MLARTSSEAGRETLPFGAAVIAQFCSAGLAWQMVSEAPEQLAWCPLSIALYILAGDPGRVRLAYRSPGRATPARIRADELLHRLVERSAELAPDCAEAPYASGALPHPHSHKPSLTDYRRTAPGRITPAISAPPDHILLSLRYKVFRLIPS